MVPQLHAPPFSVPILAGLNPLDWALVALLGFSTVTAFLRGLIRSVVSLVGVAVGLVFAAWYAPVAAVTLAPWVHPAPLAEIVAFAGVFAAVFLAASLLGRLLHGASQAVGLGFVDRLGGAAFGLTRAVLVLAVLLVPLTPFIPLIPFAGGSVLLPYLRSAAHGVSFVVPQDFGNRWAAGVQHLGLGTSTEGGFRLHKDRSKARPQLLNEGDRP